MASLSYDDVTPGDRVGPQTYEITQSLAEDHHEVIEASDRRFEDSTLVEPTILGRLSIRNLHRQYSDGGRVHAGQRLEFESPVEIGTRLVIDGEIKDKYLKRGRKYVEFDFDIRSAEGDKLGRSVITTLIEVDQ